ncbi:hypothetical protein SAMN04487785_1142 [Dyella jiangningensis]|uniref:hypothetical protein n=1 Tax=Dyella sp. AtDHG13 TaxID=1938897 RepID=UPI0008877BB0|nr:hypothetical protein [Dyella sp. AtDHG13]PXV54217.1 hypothetical protein BDW41_113171 [Dyella sp. AtDHG13]SDL03657.1 hypothetical protein SAMN04487785_1142 [Dyella jiangningensis]
MNWFLRWFHRPVLDQLAHLEQVTMSASEDLVANVAALKTAVANELQAISAKLAAAQGDDPNVVQANADIQALIEQLNAETASLEPAPAPAAEQPAQ